jgi:hypothetical protein
MKPSIRRRWCFPWSLRRRYAEEAGFEKKSFAGNGRSQKRPGEKLISILSQESRSAAEGLSDRFQFFFDIQRELGHAVGHLFGRKTGKVFQHQFFDVEPHQITQLQSAAACGKDKITMPVEPLPRNYRLPRAKPAKS